MDDCDWLLSVEKACDWLRIEPGVTGNFLLVYPVSCIMNDEWFKKGLGLVRKAPYSIGILCMELKYRYCLGTRRYKEKRWLVQTTGANLFVY